MPKAITNPIEKAKRRRGIQVDPNTETKIVAARKTNLVIGLIGA